MPVITVDIRYLPAYDEAQYFDFVVLDHESKVRSKRYRCRSEVRDLRLGERIGAVSRLMSLTAKSSGAFLGCGPSVTLRAEFADGTYEEADLPPHERPDESLIQAVRQRLVDYYVAADGDGARIDTWHGGRMASWQALG